MKGPGTAPPGRVTARRASVSATGLSMGNLRRPAVPAFAKKLCNFQRLAQPTRKIWKETHCKFSNIVIELHLSWRCRRVAAQRGRCQSCNIFGNPASERQIQGRPPTLGARVGRWRRPRVPLRGRAAAFGRTAAAGAAPPENRRPGTPAAVFPRALSGPRPAPLCTGTRNPVFRNAFHGISPGASPAAHPRKRVNPFPRSL